MIKRCIIILCLLFSINVDAFQTITVQQDTPVAYKRYLEVWTIYNWGPDLATPFWFTMVIDTRIPVTQFRVLLGGPTGNAQDAERAHQEAITWTTQRYAHLRVFIPDNSTELVLRYCTPSHRHATVAARPPLRQSASDPTSVSNSVNRNITAEEAILDMAGAGMDVLVIPHLPTPHAGGMGMDESSSSRME